MIDIWLVTALCVTLNIALVFPAGIVTVAGTEAIEASELNSVTTVPLAAGPAKTTVPVTTVLELPFTEVGEIETLTRPAG